MEDAQKMQLTAKKVHPLERKTYEELLDALDQTESLKGVALQSRASPASQ